MLLLVVGIPAFIILAPQPSPQHSEIVNATFQNSNPSEIQSNPIRTPQADSTTPPLHRNDCKIFIAMMPRSLSLYGKPQPPSAHLKIAGPAGALLGPDVGKSSGGGFE